jgi:hypothetical protein
LLPRSMTLVLGAVPERRPQRRPDRIHLACAPAIVGMKPSPNQCFCPMWSFSLRLCPLQV